MYGVSTKDSATGFENMKLTCTLIHNNAARSAPLPSYRSYHGLKSRRVTVQINMIPLYVVGRPIGVPAPSILEDVIFHQHTTEGVKFWFFTHLHVFERPLHSQFSFDLLDSEIHVSANCYTELTCSTGTAC
eukprot:gnl/TRDRNA2_/TRDRNA2_86399_c0_seq2.p1 gnl/TRDRNA2_/TRDRNA2_86399_c0~~gnl/TRDRNA2_/TRDRNA2_86399_c0_seq2.p1  ORF type:complete len:131 (+),score=9.20 gnl/TRDRNA2_/TRDRNA2_86399_c0_seq2:2-394(+)